MRKIKKLEMRGIFKSFQGVPANQDVNLTVETGEILGLLGENGAGKTTLMNILYGLYQPDKGEILINDRVVKLNSPLDSIHQGIGMVHQHFMLVQNHSVLENIALGYEKTPFFFPKIRIREEVVAFAEKFNFSIDPTKKIWQLSAGEQQRVEIIKALFKRGRSVDSGRTHLGAHPPGDRRSFPVLERHEGPGSHGDHYLPQA